MDEGRRPLSSTRFAARCKRTGRSKPSRANRDFPFVESYGCSIVPIVVAMNAADSPIPPDWGEGTDRVKSTWLANSKVPSAKVAACLNR
jgi:hypothetical protein